MNESARRTGQFALATALSVVAFHLSVFAVFFLFPLQWVRSRLGVNAFLASSALALAGIVGVAMGLKALVHPPWTELDTAVMIFPATATLGWVGIVLLERTGWRFLFRLAAVMTLAALILFPVAAWLLHREEFMRLVTSAYSVVWDKAAEVPGVKEAMPAGVSKNDFFQMLQESFLATFLLVFFLYWMVTGRLAKALEPGTHRVLRGFRVPPQGAWVFLAVWGFLLVQSLVGAGQHWDLGFWQYVLVAVALVTLVVQTLAGLGLLEALMERWRWQPLHRILFRVALVALPLAVPGGFVVLIGLPLLGVVDIWVNLRTRTQEVGQ